MSKQNKFGILIFLLISSFVFQFKTTNAWTLPEKIHITQDTLWTKDTPNLIFDKMIVLESGATLTIEKGTKIVFKVNPNQPANSAGFEVVDGKLVIIGTREDNVVLTSPDDGFALSFADNKLL